MVQNIQSNVFTFELSKIDIIAGKYLCKIAISGWLVILIIETLYGLNSSELSLRIPIVSLFFLLPLFAFLYLIFHILASKFAYKIVFNFEINEVKSFLFCKKPVVNKISDLKIVDINWHTIFRYGASRTVRTKADEKLLKMLKDKNIPTSWGFFAKLFMRNEYREYMT